MARRLSSQPCIEQPSPNYPGVADDHYPIRCGEGAEVIARECLLDLGETQRRPARSTIHRQQFAVALLARLMPSARNQQSTFAWSKTMRLASTAPRVRHR
jgi:hypothetical protein